jgi:hypothetical protein
MNYRLDDARFRFWEAGNGFSLLHNAKPAFCSDSNNSPFAEDKVAEVRQLFVQFVQSLYLYMFRAC